MFLEWLERIGPWGPAALAAIYIPATLLAFPGSLLTLAGGFIFGIWRTVIAVSIGSTLGASAAFLLGRFLLRDVVAERVARRPAFAAIDGAVADRGFPVVFLIRLSPLLPFNLLNYAFGLTRVRFRDYFFGSWLGMLPGTIMYAYFGSLFKNIADVLAGKIEPGLAPSVLFVIGLVATVVATVMIARAASRALAANVSSTTTLEKSA
jgi:uncharacterized membrane protein YdjX (TVP38/TMEM64 family)